MQGVYRGETQDLRAPTTTGPTCVCVCVCVCVWCLGGNFGREVVVKGTETARLCRPLPKIPNILGAWALCHLPQDDEKNKTFG